MLKSLTQTSFNKILDIDCISLRYIFENIQIFYQLATIYENVVVTLKMLSSILLNTRQHETRHQRYEEEMS